MHTYRYICIDKKDRVDSIFACYMSIATLSKEKEDMGLRYRENEGERVPRGDVWEHLEGKKEWGNDVIKF